MSYAPWSVIAGEQPTTSKWNILGTNDAGFNDGSAFAWGSSAVLTGGPAWASWTPTCVTLTPGNGTLAGKFVQIGKTVLYDLSLLFGSTTSITGSIFTFSFPTTPLARTTAQSLAFPFGEAVMLDSSASTYYSGTVAANNATLGEILAWRADSATFLATQNAMNSSNPFTWATGDYMYARGFYETT